MSRDSELLELAAKAADIQLVGPVEKFIVQFDERHKGGFIIHNERGGHSAWNPLTDDGDALRLAVKLGVILDVRYTEPTSMKFNEVCYWPKGRHASPYKRICFDDKEADLQAATRRAIVMAAAAIGKDMP